MALPLGGSFCFLWLAPHFPDICLCASDDFFFSATFPLMRPMTHLSHFRRLMRTLPLLFLFLSLHALPSAADVHDLCAHVDPRIGSEGLGRTFVGPSMPFGMVKPGPDCLSMPNAGWAPMPEVVKGFTQTHVSGTGGGQKYGNVLIQPVLLGDKPTSQPLLMPDGGVSDIPVYAQRRTAEDLSLGYYRCTYDNGITTEVTTSERCALYRFHRADGLFVDVASFLGMDSIPDKRETQQYVGSAFRQTNAHELVGHTTVRGGWNNGGPYTVYFCLQSDVPFKPVSMADSLSAKLLFTTPSGPTQALVSDSRLTDSIANVKVGISYVSEQQARRNICQFPFDTQLDSLRASWEALLRRVPYQGTDKERRMFYTALYHTLLMPVDKTGEEPAAYRPDDEAPAHRLPYYDDYYALWDTYRTSFPLLMEYYPERAVGMVNSLLNIYLHDGYMPDARSGDCNGRTQGGSHAEVVIAEAYARRLNGIDYELALQAMLKDAEVPPANDEKEGRGGLDAYKRLGFIPYGIPRAGTRTVEYSYDDWCIAQVARGLGHSDLYQKYMARSRNWRNLWRADYEWQGMRGFIMPRAADGQWLDSVVWGQSAVCHPKIAYRPDTKVAPWYIPWWNTFFYEALSAEYSLSVPHDVAGLITLCGGDSAFRRRLDTFFDQGHYNVANEPSFLTPYLYHYIGRPDLSAARVSQIVRHNFSATPAGLPGNDDSGAMSSWLVWAMLGRYPVAGQGTWLRIPPVRVPDGAEPALAERHGKVSSEPAVEAMALPERRPMATVRFVLNRQYRNWPLSWTVEGDTLRMVCHGNLYRIPQSVVDRADAFCWDSPQWEGRSYTCQGTFLFVSRKALSQLVRHHCFVYDGQTWREVGRREGVIRVQADVDGTEMWIATNRDLPFVVRMANNKLGIDWTLE